METKYSRVHAGPRIQGWARQAAGAAGTGTLARDGTGGRMRQGAFFLVFRVKGRNAREGGGRRRGFGEVFVAFEAHGNADLGFRLGRSGTIWNGRCCGPNHSQDTAAAAHGHALAQGDFGGHAECEFDFGAFSERSVGEEEDSARTQVLGESDAFKGSPRLTQREREKIREPLSDTAFNSNWRSSHIRVTSFAESPKAQALL